MKKTILDSKLLDDKLGCFGRYDPDDPVCTKWCQLNIRCAIARDRRDRLEILEEFFETVTETTRPQ